MPSQRVRYAMAHLSHEQHISLLARPNWRRIQTTNLNTLRDPYSTSRAALKSRASKRIRIMAQPKCLAKKSEPVKTLTPPPRTHPKVHLTHSSRRRILDLALPKKRSLLATKRFAASNRKINERVTKLLDEVRASRYQRYRVFCNAAQERELRKKRKHLAKMRKALSKPEDWKRHMQLLATLAAPKKVHKMPQRRRDGKRTKWRRPNMRRIQRLAQAPAKELLHIRDPSKVSPAALTYQITSRMKELAFRKNPRVVVPPKIPGAVSFGAKQAVATPRTIELAAPAVRPAGVETDLREDAFTVSPTALKAVCSKRLKILAKPKTYKIPKK